MLLKTFYVLSVLTCAFYMGKSIWCYTFSCENKDPTIKLNITEIIRSSNLNAEEHYLTTDDGYIILVERVFSSISKENPVILAHGLFIDGLAFVNRDEKSLGFILANLGYDVWILNVRGTRYSRGHLTLSPKNREYWRFSLDDVGTNDVRCTIKYVNNVTKKKPFYLGMSMGTTLFFIYSSTFPTEGQELVKGMIALAPAINFKNNKSWLEKILPVWPILKFLVYNLNYGEVPPLVDTIFGPFVYFKHGRYALQYFFELCFGEADYDQTDSEYLPRLLHQSMVTTGVEVFSQYMQVFETPVLRRYDYGKVRNLELYGNEKAPPYNLSMISVPVALFFGKNDVLTTIEGVEQLYEELQPTSRCGYHAIDFEKWNHVDFTIAKDVDFYVFRHVVDKLEQLESGICKN